jgi:hypothetical protein
MQMPINSVARLLAHIARLRMSRMSIRGLGVTFDPRKQHEGGDGDNGQTQTSDGCPSPHRAFADHQEQRD